MADTTDQAERPRSTEPAGALAPVDLLLPLGELRPLATAEASAGAWLDACLLVATVAQVVDDVVARSRSPLDRLAEHGAALGVPFASAVAPRVAAAVRSGHRRRPAVRDLGEHARALHALATDLAAAYLDGSTGTERATSLAERTAALMRPSPLVTPYLDRIPRLPAAFRSFDQHPRDVVELVGAFAAARGVDRPVLVVGVRTSGSHLAPFAAAELRRRGATHVDLITVRPGEQLDADQQAAVAALGSAGHAVVIDDPPVSGEAIARVGAELGRAGLRPDAVVLLLGTDAADGSLPPPLDPYPRHVLEPARWHLRRRLDPGRVVDDMAHLLGPDRSLSNAQPIDAGPLGRDGRDHLRCWVRAVLHDGPAGTSRPVLLVAQAVGVGFYGRHAVGLARRLGGLVPTVLAFDDGILYQLVTGADGQAPELVHPSPATIAAYAAARRRALPAAADRSGALLGRQAVWEVAAELVGQASGRLDPVLRMTLVNPAVRAVLRPDAPSIIDGRPWRAAWFGAEAGPVKLDFADGAFSNHDLACYDAAYDVAASTRPGDDPQDLRAARRAFEAEVGAVGAARWLLLRLVHAWDQRRAGDLDATSWGPELSGLLADFVGETALDLPAPTAGGWVALDLDGVVETTLIGSSAPGAAGATALRALAAHGHRVVPCTGRGAPEVARRVAAWNLPGAVVEYGAGLVVAGEPPIDERDDRGRQAMDRLRATLAARPDVTVDPGHHFAVRAWRRDGRGSRRALAASLVADAVAEAGGAEAVTAIAGDDQTDFVPAGTTKEQGVIALLDRLEPGIARAGRPLALAVGDSLGDRGFLRLAQLAVVPGHAAAVAEPGMVVSPASYQAGLLDAVGRLLGHGPGGCPTCALHLSAADRAVLDLLSVHEAGSRAMPARVARAAASVVRLRHAAR